MEFDRYGAERVASHCGAPNRRRRSAIGVSHRVCMCVLVVRMHNDGMHLLGMRLVVEEEAAVCQV